MENLTMEKAKKELKESLIFQMSLGSKELYHSNIWSWIIKKDPRFLKVFFKEYDESAFEMREVKRENKHRDIIITLRKQGDDADHYYYVIENKIKSLPNEEQLKKYTTDIDSMELIGATYTGIKNTLNKDVEFKYKDNLIKWNFLSYNDISEGFIRLLDDDENTIFNSFDCKLIKKYCYEIKCINYLLEESLKEHERVLCYNVDKDLDDMSIRLLDVYKKLKASDLLNYIIEKDFEVIENLCPKELQFEVKRWVDYYNSQATIEIRFTNENENKNNIFKIGIEIQEYQYRRFVQIDGQLELDKLFEEFEKKGWFDGTYDAKSKRLVFGHDTTMKPKYGKKYNSYNTRDYRFVYQYYDIKEENNSYDDVYDAIILDLTKAKEIIEDKFSSLVK